MNRFQLVDGQRDRFCEWRETSILGRPGFEIGRRLQWFLRDETRLAEVSRLITSDVSRANSPGQCLSGINRAAQAQVESSKLAMKDGSDSTRCGSEVSMRDDKSTRCVVASP